MDSSKNERIKELDEEITKLREHASMRARAGGASNAVIDTFERVKELQLEKEDLINGTNKLDSYKQEKRIRKLEDEIDNLKSLKESTFLLKKRQYDSQIKSLEQELKNEQSKGHSR